MTSWTRDIGYLLRGVEERVKYAAVDFFKGFPGGSEDKASASNVGDPGSIPGSERSGEGNGNPL